MVSIDNNNFINKSGTKTICSHNGTKVCQQKPVVVHEITYKLCIVV